MLRLVTILLALSPAITLANPCYNISQDTARLACYEQMSACLGIKGADARLACFDAKMQSTVSTPDSTVNAGQSISETPANPAAQPDVSNFGIAPKQPSEESSTIVNVDTRKLDGVDFITLANHQVWRETMDQTNRFKVGQAVTIKPGVFGSYSLFCKDIGPLIKVHRVN